MSYHSGSPSAILAATLLQNAPWYPIAEFLGLLTAISTTDLSSPTSKFDSLTLLRNLTSTVPYTIPDGSPTRPTSVRFSGNPPLPTALFICQGFAAWHVLFEDFAQALSAPPTGDYSTDPSVPLFYSTLEQATHQLQSGFGVFNYQLFEATFALHWF